MWLQIRFRWSWDTVQSVLPQLLDGLVVTLEAALLGFALSLVVGLILALAGRSKLVLVSWPAKAFLEFVRSTPLVVQLFFLWTLLDFLPALHIGIVGLGLHFGTYTAEIYRAGIEAVDIGQWRAAIALNFSTRHIWTKVILPQAVPPMIPALGNYLIGMFKETPQLFAIGVMDMFNEAQSYGIAHFRFLEPVTLVGVIYFLVSYSSSILVRRLEARYGRAEA